MPVETVINLTVCGSKNDTRIVIKSRAASGSFSISVIEAEELHKQLGHALEIAKAAQGP